MLDWIHGYELQKRANPVYLSLDPVTIGTHLVGHGELDHKGLLQDGASQHLRLNKYCWNRTRNMKLQLNNMLILQMVHCGTHPL